MKTNKILLWLTALIALLALVASAIGAFWQDGNSSFQFTTLHGQTITMQGSGLYGFDSVSAASQVIGQDFVTLLVGIPLLIVSATLYLKGSLRGKLLLTGTLAYFLYTYASYAFGVAYNSLFLIYVTLFSASLYAFVLALMSIRIDELPAHFSAKLPRRFLSGLAIFVGAMLALLWLGRIVPPLLSGGVPVGLDSYSTLFIQVLDLGAVAPTAVLAGVLLLRKRPFGYLLTSVVLIKGFTMLTAISAMIVGQWLAGVQMSAVDVILFPLVNLVVIAATVLMLRNVSDSQLESAPKRGALAIVATP